MANTQKQLAQQPGDFALHDHGSIVILVPLSCDAVAWCEEHLPADAMRWAGGYAIEPRYADDIIEGARSEGLTVCAA